MAEEIDTLIPHDQAVDPASAGSAARLFDPRLLDRCLMSKEAAAAFRDEGMRCVRYDELTGAQVIAYLHPDGRVLIDSIGQPNALDQATPTRGATNTQDSE